MSSSRRWKMAFLSVLLLTLLFFLCFYIQEKTTSKPKSPSGIEAEIPDHENARCLVMLEVMAAQTALKKGSRLNVDWNQAPKPVQENCKWIRDKINHHSDDKISTADSDLQHNPIIAGTVQKKWRESCSFVSLNILGELLNSPDMDVQIQSLITVSECRLKQFENKTIDLTASTTADIRMLAAETLAVIGTPKAFQPLVALLQDQDGFVKYKAAWALGFLRAKQGVGPLSKALSDPDIDVVRQAAESLGAIGDPSCLENLLEALCINDIFVRQTIVKSLKAFTKNGHDKTLQQTYSQLPAEKKKQIGSALWRMGESNLLILTKNQLRERETVDNWEKLVALKKEALHSRDVKQLIKWLSYPDGEVSKQAASSISLLGDVAAVAPLIAAWAKADPDTKAMILLAFGTIGDSRAIPILQDTLSKEKDSDLIRRAIVALGLCGGKSEAEDLAPFLTHKDGMLRAIAATSIGLLKSDYGANIINNNLTDSSARVRFWSSWAVGYGNDPVVCDKLASQLKPNFGIFNSGILRSLRLLNCPKVHTFGKNGEESWWLAIKGFTELDDAVMHRKIWHLGKRKYTETLLQ